MGQVHSDEYNCNETSGGGGGGGGLGGLGRVEDVADSEINTNDGTLADQGRHHKGGRSSKMSTEDERQLHVRKLSNVSHRNIQLLSMRPRSEKDAYADDLRTRRRSSLINLILGAPSSGPRFCDDLCSLNSHMSELHFGIESFPEPYFGGSTSTLRLAASIEDPERGGHSKIRPTKSAANTAPVSQRVRRSSTGGALAAIGISDNPTGLSKRPSNDANLTKAPSMKAKKLFEAKSRNPSLASTLASIDLTSSFEQNQQCAKSPVLHLPVPVGSKLGLRPPLVKSRQLEGGNPVVAAELVRKDTGVRVSRCRINQPLRTIRGTGSELSLYSTISAGSSDQVSCTHDNQPQKGNIYPETVLIILLQVALPFMFAGFGNMSAGLVLDLVSRKQAFISAPILFVLLPPLIGLKGNIEMTLASRFSTLSNLNLLQTSHQRRQAYASNLTLVISQAVGLSLFAAAVSIICEVSMFAPIGSTTPHETNLKISLPLGTTTLAVFASALTTCLVLVIISSIVMSAAVALANLIQVNPDNLSTLIAAMYGDVSCVYVYGMVADWMFSLMERNLLVWPSIIVTSTLLLWPIALFLSYKFKQTHNVALYSLPPMVISILISMGSGALLSLFVGKFKLIALYQPVVNGFGANLVAVQASRVSTWLWCSALGKFPKSSEDKQREPKELPSAKVISSLATFTAPEALGDHEKEKSRLITNSIGALGKSIKLLLWSFCNSSPNATAARLLLVMLIPAHTIYFFVIWILSPTSHVVITWQFYAVYIGLCLIQVFILLTICEPFMTLLMRHNMDPDVFGISILMAIADLAGTICLTLAFCLLAKLGDVNALQ